MKERMERELDTHQRIVAFASMTAFSGGVRSGIAVIRLRPDLAWSDTAQLPEVLGELETCINKSLPEHHDRGFRMLGAKRTEIVMTMGDFWVTLLTSRSVAVDDAMTLGMMFSEMITRNGDETNGQYDTDELRAMAQPWYAPYTPGFQQLVNIVRERRPTLYASEAMFSLRRGGWRLVTRSGDGHHFESGVMQLDELIYGQD